MLSTVQSNLPLLVGAGLTHVALASIGVFPKLGPGRALYLAVRSFFFPRAPTPSIHPDLVKEIPKLLRIGSPRQDDQYGTCVVVYGPEFSETKTVLITDALKKTPGVIKVSVHLGASTTSKVLHEVYDQIVYGRYFGPGTNPKYRYQTERHARRILFWYKHLGVAPAIISLSALFGLLFGGFDPLLMVIGVISSAAFAFSSNIPRGIPIIVLKDWREVASAQTKEAADILTEKGLHVVIQSYDRILGDWTVPVPPTKEEDPPENS